MKFNGSLLYLLQELTFNLIDLISPKEYKDFVLDSLKIAHQSLDQDSKICAELLYSRLENVDEKDILTFMELDRRLTLLYGAVLPIILLLFVTIPICHLEKYIFLKQLKVLIRTR